jgi:hypothetical protein
MSVLPGNELYEIRFELIENILLSMENTEFIGNSVSEEDIESIFSLTDKYDWTELEDYAPIKINKLNKIVFRGKEYFFLPGELEIPEITIQTIANRLLNLETTLSVKLNYSILEALQETLLFQEQIVKFVIENVNILSKDKIAIPKQSEVTKWASFLETTKAPNLNTMWAKEKINVNLPNFAIDAHKFFSENPLIYGKFYMPSILLSALEDKIIHDIRDLVGDNKLELKIEMQLKNSIFSSLLEIIPEEAIMENFSIMGVDLMIDIGFVFDKNLFLFMPVSNLSKGTLDKLYKINEFIKNGNAKLFLYGNEITLDSKIELFVFFIGDNVSEGTKIISLPRSKEFNNFFIEINELKQLFQDMASGDKDFLFFLNILRIYQKNEYPLLNLNNFYARFVYPKEYSIAQNESGEIEKLLPESIYTWSRIYRGYLLNKRPILDVELPFLETLPYEFSVIKLYDDNYYCYNNEKKIRFFYHAGNIAIYVLNEKNELLSIPFSGVIFEILTPAIEKIKDLVEEGSKIEIVIDPKDYEDIKEINGLKEYYCQKTENPVLLCKTDKKNYYILLFDKIGFSKIYNENSWVIPYYLIKSIFDKVIKIDDLELEKILKSINFDKELAMGTTRTVGNINLNYITVPDEIDYFNFEQEIQSKFDFSAFNLLKSDKKSEFLNKVYKYLSNKLKDLIQNLDLKSFIFYCYGELERGMRLREYNAFKFKQSKEIGETDAFYKELAKTEQILQDFLPACRFLIEEKILLNEEGEEFIGPEKFKEILLTCQNMLSVSSISDYTRIFGQIFIAKVDENMPGIYTLHINSAKAAFEKLVKNLIYWRLEEVDKNYNVSDTHTEDIKRNLYVSGENIIKKDKLLSEANKELKKAFGFTIIEFIKISNALTYFEELLNGVNVIITINSNLAINKIKKRTELDEETIQKVINYLTLNAQKEDSTLEPWKLRKRKNRLVLKPLIRIGDDIIFGSRQLLVASEMFVLDLINGIWGYDTNFLPKKLKNAIDNIKRQKDQNFEKEITDTIRKIIDTTDIVKRNLKGRKAFLSKISKEVPGEIDVFSIQKSKKRIILWEAKNIEPRYASREVLNVLLKLMPINEKSNYLYKVLRKVDFIRTHLIKILNYYNITDTTDWKLEYCFVLPANVPAKYLLESNINVISLEEIKEFLSK